ncbi:MAG: hypothetical protein JNK05_25335 [Myxococcales bacterium]|nr:hypothetical protein [Myxococcales bacterium]
MTTDATLDSRTIDSGMIDSGAESDVSTPPDAALERDAQEADAACAPLAPNGCPLQRPSPIQMLGCDDGCNAARAEFTCEYPRERCRCLLGAGYRWQCEPIECPAAGPVVGAACTTGDVMCAMRFEDPGYRCIDGAWARCSFARRPDPNRPGLHCPPEAPIANSVCCVVNFGGAPGAPRECQYRGSDGGVQAWDCVNFRWTPISR